jgi:hypothetical protein
VTIGLSDFIDVADTRVIQRRRCLSLSPESGLDFLFTQQVGRKELQRDRALEVRVFGLVDNTHPAFTELLGDAVVADGLTDHETPILPLNA